MSELIDTLRGLQQVSPSLDTRMFALALIASLIAALVASWLYVAFYENRGTGSQVHRSFPLLGISITSLFVSIQLSLPLSLGLLGALSIIRFRTPIKEPEEVGFIMLVIASSVSCATLNFGFLVLLHVVALLTLLFLRWARVWGRWSGDGMIVLNSNDSQTTDHLHEVIHFIEAHTVRSRLDSSSFRSGVTSLQFTFSGLTGGLAAFQEGLRARGNFDGINIFFNRPGGIR